MDTPDGLSKYPYIRESRRIAARGRVTEQDIIEDTQPGPRARLFEDSVGIGFYMVDIHPCGANERGRMRMPRPFQIPMSALLPREALNFLPGEQEHRRHSSDERRVPSASRGVEYRRVRSNHCQPLDRARRAALCRASTDGIGRLGRAFVLVRRYRTGPPVLRRHPTRGHPRNLSAGRCGPSCFTRGSRNPRRSRGRTRRDSSATISANPTPSLSRSATAGWPPITATGFTRTFRSTGPIGARANSHRLCRRWFQIERAPCDAWNSLSVSNRNLDEGSRLMGTTNLRGFR